MTLKLAAGTLSLVLLSTAAWAQAAPPPPPPDAPPGPMMEAPPPPGMGPPGAMMDDGMRGPRGRGPRHGPRGGFDGPPPPPPPSKAAEFQFKRGPLEMRFRCAEDEPIKPCADAALTLMDKFGSLSAGMPDMPPPPPRGAEPAPPPAGAEPPPPAPGAEPTAN